MDLRGGFKEEKTPWGLEEGQDQADEVSEGCKVLGWGPRIGDQSPSRTGMSSKAYMRGLPPLKKLKSCPSLAKILWDTVHVRK